MTTRDLIVDLFLMCLVMILNVLAFAFVGLGCVEAWKAGSEVEALVYAGIMLWLAQGFNRS